MSHLLRHAGPAVGVAALMCAAQTPALGAEPSTDELRRMIELQQQQIELQRQQMEQQSRELERMRDELDELQAARQPSQQRLAIPTAGDPLPPPQRPPEEATVAQEPDYLIGKPAKGGPPEAYVAPAQAVTAGEFPGSIRIPGTEMSLRIGGYAKLDVIHDFQDIGEEDQFVTSTIPTRDRRDGGRTRLHARQSRLNVDARSPSEIGPLRVFVEGDFFGAGGNQTVSNSTSFRIRHAFGEISDLFGANGDLLAGQTWSTFMDVSALPETIDFAGPPGESFIRTPQLRWTQRLTDGLSLAAAIENPESDISEGGGNNFDQLPDGILHARWEQDWGHLQAGFVGRQIRLDDGDISESDFGWGVNASGLVKLPFLHENDNFVFQANYGDGIGRYIVDIAGLGADAAFDPATGALETLTAFGTYGAYQHWWTDTLRSTAVYSYVHLDSEDFQPGDTFENSQYVAANLIWSPIPRIDVGVEYLYGQREDQDGESGSDNRLQFGFLFRF